MRLVASVEELLEEARQLDLSSTQSRFRLGDLIEALGRELPAVADLHDRLAIDLQLDRGTLTEAWFVAGAFPSATRRSGLPWASYVILRFHPERHELADRAAREAGTMLASIRSSRHTLLSTTSGRTTRHRLPSSVPPVELSAGPAT
jgi:hypothetical protein